MPKKSESQRFDLAYRVRNQGDGSVAVVFHQDEIEAEKAEDKELEEYGEVLASPLGWPKIYRLID